MSIAGFAKAWLGGGSPAPLPGFELHALPDRYAGQVLDGAGRQVPLDGAEFRWVGSAGFWTLPPSDGAGVPAGVWYAWTDAWEALTRSRRRPGGRYPRSTALLARYRGDPRVALLFSLGPPTHRGVQSWIGMSRGWDAGVPAPFGPDGRSDPAFRPAPSIIPGVDHFLTERPAPPEIDGLSRPGAHRASQWERAYGGRLWGGILVSVRGYPDVRVLQVAIAERWLDRAEAYLPLQQALRRTHFWPWSSAGRVVVAPDEENDLIGSATDQLLDQAVQGQHTPAFPLGSRYLRGLTRKVLTTLPDRSRHARPALPLDEAGDAEDGLAEAQPPRHHGQPRPGTTRLLDGTIADQPAASPWSDRQLRRVTAQLARQDGLPSLTLLKPKERRAYEAHAVQLMRDRQQLHDLRKEIRETLAARDATVTRRAVELFVQSHRHQPPGELERAVRAYLDKPRRRSTH